MTAFTETCDARARALYPFTRQELAAAVVFLARDLSDAEYATLLEDLVYTRPAGSPPAPAAAPHL